MAFQMIYTSVKSGLVAGRSGFCTAARHQEIKEVLVSRIEDFSNQYDRGSDGTGRSSTLPVIYSHRLVTVRNETCHLLMRIADAGNDYSGRTNHIAHSIVIGPEEIDRLRVTPAEVILELIRRGIWRERYEESARLFGPDEEIDLSKFSPTVSFPAEEWARQTGKAEAAALLAEPGAAQGAGVVLPDSYEPEMLLRLFAESELLESPDRSQPRKFWDRSFTTLIQSDSQRSDFDWYGSVYNSRVHMALLKGKRHLIELAQGMAVPNNELSQIAAGEKLPDKTITEEPARSEIAPIKPLKKNEPQSASESARQPAATDGPQPASVGSVARKIASGPSSGAAIPLDLLGSTGQKKKSGLGKWLVIAPVAVILAAIGLGAFLYMRPAQVAERELGALLKERNWEAALTTLNQFPTSEQETFADSSAGFSEYARLLRQYEQVHNDLRDAAFQTETFLDRSKKLSTSAGPLRMLEENRKALERSLKHHPDKLMPPTRLNELQVQAQEVVRGYIQEEKAITKAWSNLMEMNSSGIDVDAMRERVYSLNTGADRLLVQLDDIADVIPFVGEYEQATQKEYASAAAAASASHEFTLLSEKLSRIQSKSSGRDWQKYIAAIRKKVATFEPKVTVARVSTNSSKATPTKASDGSGNSTKPQLVTTPPIPKTWVVSFSEKAGEISYQHISDLASGLPEAIAITANDSFSPDVVERKKELAEINGETVMYYYTGQDTVKIFAIDERAKVLRLAPDFRLLFGKGFQMSWGKAGKSEPDFLVFGQRPDSVAFQSISSQRGLQKTAGAETEIHLSPDSLALLKQIHLPPGQVTYEWYFDENSVPEVASDRGAESLRISPSEQLDQQIETLESRIKTYASMREITAQFDETFRNVGDKLFALDDGKITTEGWKVKSFPRKGKAPEFGLVPDPESTEVISSDICVSLEDYIKRSGDFIEGPPFLHYLSAHLGENLWDHGLSGAKTVKPEAIESVRGAFSKIRSFENWGDDEVKEAIRLLGTITETGKNFRLSALAETSERFPNQEEAERFRKRREKDFRQNQITARFFAAWGTTFTPENLQLAEQVILGGSFDEAKLAQWKAELEQKKAKRKSISDTPLDAWGTVRIKARVVGEDSSETIFSLLEISGN